MQLARRKLIPQLGPRRGVRKPSPVGFGTARPETGDRLNFAFFRVGLSGM